MKFSFKIIFGLFILLLFFVSVWPTNWEDKCHRLAGSKAEQNSNGVGIEYKSINPEIAIPACQKALSLNRNASNLFRLSRALHKAKKYKQSLPLVREAVKLNYALAQNNLGAMFDNGQGILKDQVQAVKWYRKSADQEYARAQYNLGVLYHSGLGVSRDMDNAIRNYNISAKKNYAPAITALRKIEERETAPK